MSDIDANEIECPRCGEKVFMDVLVCPKCGLHFYPEDGASAEEERQEHPQQARSSIGISAVGVLAGVLVAGGTAFLIQRLADVLWPLHQGTGFQVLILASGPLGALAGGFLAALIAHGWGIRNGLAVGIAALVPAYFLHAYWQDLTRQPLDAGSLVVWAVLVACGALGGLLWERLSMRATAKELFQPHSQYNEKELYLELLSEVRHDIDTAERLIELERGRNPKMGRPELIRNALDRLEHDRR